MLKKNNIAAGIVAGIILPGITWIIFGYMLKNRPVVLNKAAVPYLLALALNLFAIKYLFKKGADQTGSGMIISTFVVMVLIFLYQIINK